MPLSTTPSTEETDPLCLDPARAAELLADAPWRRFAVIGDSLSAGTGDATPGYASVGWADRVADVLRRVRADLAYLNTAEIGVTTAETLALQADRMVDFGPDLLHVPCGANDLFDARPDFPRIERTLRRLFACGADTGAQLTVFTLGNVFVVGKFADWQDRVRRLNAITRSLAAEHGAVLAEMWDHPVNRRANLLSADRIHWSTSGQAVMAAEIVRGLAAVLGTDRRGIA